MGQGVPALGSNPTLAEQQGPDTLTEPIPQRTEYPWDYSNVAGGASIQPILDSKCISCHNDTKNGNQAQTFYVIGFTDPVSGATTQYQIPRFNMCGLTANQYCSGQPITVRYDRGTYSWPASYVSIFYPSAMAMTKGITLISGTVPPMWGIPANARGSQMIVQMNVTAPDNTTAWPVSQHPMHPEDVGVTVTPTERLALIRSIDLGGQYYARQNTKFVPVAASSDPVAHQ
jgi:hypothetical protein